MAETFIDIPATIGETAAMDNFQLAVHLTIFWAQDNSGGPLWQSYMPSRSLTERLRMATPLEDGEIMRWPPSAADLDLSQAPRDVPIQPVKKGRAGWQLSEHNFVLRKILQGFQCEVVIWIDEESQRIRLRQTVTLGMGGKRLPGVPRNLKMISAACGLYDGDVRLLPTPILVHSPEDAREFLELAQHPDRQQTMLAIAMDRSENAYGWQRQVERISYDLFGLQHIVGVTLEGVNHLREIMDVHGLPPGSVKSYFPGFSLLDRQSDHAVITAPKIKEFFGGRDEAVHVLGERQTFRDAKRRR